VLTEIDKGVDVGTTDVAAVSEVRLIAISNITDSIFTNCFMDEDIFYLFHFGHEFDEFDE